MTSALSLFPRHIEKLSSWSFTGTFGRNFERLINLQMWCFGCDIRRDKGNILTEFGFTKVRSPHSTHGSTRYSAYTADGYSLHLWGFGMVISDDATALCVKRFGRVPQLRHGGFDPQDIFKPHHLPPFYEPQTTTERTSALRLLTALSHHMLVYERYLVERELSSFRRTCVTTSPKAGRLRGNVPPYDAWQLLQ